MRKIVRTLFLVLHPYFCLSFCLLSAAEVIPVGDFRFLGGQYFFNSSPSSLSGNISYTVVPAVKFSDRFSLVPAYAGSYRGTKEVSDLVGGGTLFQDGQNHLASLKGIYSVTPSLKLKLGASYRLELLRETRDENWGKGLFDYQKINTGIEAEYAYVKNHAVRVGVDNFTLAFPNYESLESSVTSSGLGRELAGKNTLNAVNLMQTITLNDTFGRLKTELGYGITNKAYPNQPVVLATGDLSGDKRKDIYSLARAGLAYPFKLIRGVGLLASVNAQYVANDSTQAHYDAKTPKFIPDYYDYTYAGVSPAVDFILGSKPWAVSIGASVGQQSYAQRPAQDAGGKYLDEKILVNETVLSLSVVYPLNKDFKLRMISNFVDSKSNMKYEATFAYNYQTANYLFGFSYEF